MVSIIAIYDKYFYLILLICLYTVKCFKLLLFNVSYFIDHYLLFAHSQQLLCNNNNFILHICKPF